MQEILIKNNNLQLCKLEGIEYFLYHGEHEWLNDSEIKLTLFDSHSKEVIVNEARIANVIEEDWYSDFHPVENLYVSVDSLLSDDGPYCSEEDVICLVKIHSFYSRYGYPCFICKKSELQQKLDGLSKELYKCKFLGSGIY